MEVFLEFCLYHRRAIFDHLQSSLAFLDQYCQIFRSVAKKQACVPLSFDGRPLH